MVSARRDKMKEKAKEYLQFMNEKIYSQLSYAENVCDCSKFIVCEHIFTLLSRSYNICINTSDKKIEKQKQKL